MVDSRWDPGAVVGAASSGADSAQFALSVHRAKPYDFRRPDKLSKENLRVLRMVHETFSRLAGVALFSHLRTIARVQLQSIEQMTYEHYVAQLPQPGLTSVVKLDPLPGHALFGMDLDTSFVVLDRLLGGPGTGASRARELTDIEHALFRRFVSHLLTAYAEAWAGILPLRASLEEVVLDPQFVQVARPGDVTVRAAYEVKLLESTGILTICLPYAALEPAMDRLSTQARFAPARPIPGEQSGDAPDGDYANLEGHLRGVRIELTAELGRAALTFRELLDLRAGDVIKLRTGVHDELTLCAEGKPKYLCRPGLNGRSLGVQVTRALDESEVTPDGRRSANLPI